MINVRMENVIPGGSVWLGSGINIETGARVTFGGDHRAMAVVAEALAADDGEDVIAEVEEWSVLSNIAVIPVK